MNNSITLIGMPGAGKSSVGVVLAKRLAKDFIDCDLVIQKTFGRSLQELIDERGSEGFMELEGATLCSLHPENAVVATGGSAVYSDGAMRHLSRFGPLLYLRAGLDEIAARLGSLEERGVVMREGKGMSLEDIYAERAPLYQKYASLAFDVDGRPIRECVLGIEQLLRRALRAAV